LDNVLKYTDIYFYNGNQAPLTEFRVININTTNQSALWVDEIFIYGTLATDTENSTITLNNPQPDNRVTSPIIFSGQLTDNGTPLSIKPWR